MITHIVMWKLKAADAASRAADAARIKQVLEDLNGKIPGLLHLEIGINYAAHPSANDLVLYSRLTDKAALEGYQAHAAHQAVVPIVAALTSERHMVDYET